MNDKSTFDDGIDRRAVLRLTGAAAAAGTAFSAGAGAQPNGGPFLEPTDDNVNFCGCSQVCVCTLKCGTGTVIIDGAEDQPIEECSCLEDLGGQILAVDDGETVWCNPNTACADFDREEFGCDEIGVAPQFGYQCGEAFIENNCEECDGDPDNGDKDPKDGNDGKEDDDCKDEPKGDGDKTKRDDKDGNGDKDGKDGKNDGKDGKDGKNDGKDGKNDGKDGNDEKDGDGGVMAIVDRLPF